MIFFSNCLSPADRVRETMGPSGTTVSNLQVIMAWVRFNQKSLSVGAMARYESNIIDESVKAHIAILQTNLFSSTWISFLKFESRLFLKHFEQISQAYDIVTVFLCISLYFFLFVAISHISRFEPFHGELRFFASI